MKNFKIIIILFLVQLFYMGTVMLSCVWDSTMFTALRVLTYFAWGYSLLYINYTIRRYEHSKKNRRKAIVIYAIGCVCVLTAQFISASKPNLVIALIFTVFLFVMYLVELELVFDIRKSMLDETILELEKNPNKELFVGITRERNIRNHSLLVTALIFGLLFTYIGIPLLCSQDYFFGIKALIFLYAWDIAMLVMRLYVVRAQFSRYMLEIICFQISMMCLSIVISKLNWAMQQTFLQLGCILAIVPIVFGVVKDIREIRKGQ